MNILTQSPLPYQGVGPTYSPPATMGAGLSLDFGLSSRSFDGFAGGFPRHGPLGPDLGGSFQSFLGGYCPCGPNPSVGSRMMIQMLQMMAQLMQMMMLMGGAGQSGGLTGMPSASSPNFGAAGALTSANGGAVATAPAAPTPSAGAGAGASPVRIGPGTRVLTIGDSHSVGTFGKELDRLMRGTGAQVSTYASAGATGSTFAKGNSTRYGYWQKRADGSESTTNYGQSRATPRLENLIGQEKPQVIVVNLGANFRGGDPKSQVDQIGRIAKKHNIPLVWVGPPKTAKDNGNPASLQDFDRKMAAAVAPYGTYVPSTPHTSRYAGGDGLHYSGSQGNQIARQWAQGVFKAVAG